MKIFTSKSQRIGEIGEGIACRYLVSKGYVIVERNYTRKWGELDIVASKDNTLHLVEVKSVRSSDLDEKTLLVRPEENMNKNKTERLKRIIQTYLESTKYKGDWQFDLVCVYLDSDNKKAKIKVLENIIL